MNYVLGEVDLHVTNRCNLRCPICSYSSNELTLPELPVSVIREIAGKVKDMGCESIHITGGEPTLRDDLLDIVATIRDAGVEHIRLQTNGSRISHELLYALHDRGLSSIMISMDSADPEINDKYRGRGAFSSALRAIEACLECNADLRVNAVLHRGTVDSFPQLVKYLAALGVKRISSFYFTPIGRGQQNMHLWLPPQDYRKAFSRMRPELERLAKEFNVDVIVEPSYLDWQSASEAGEALLTGCGGGCQHCFEMREYLIVRCDGEVFPCSLWLGFGTGLGNIENVTLESVYRRSLKWYLLDRRWLRERSCEGCKGWTLCGGGCLVYAHLLGSGADSEDPRCNKADYTLACPIMKYNALTQRYGGSSDDVQS